jgi:hypothetical protein
MIGQLYGDIFNMSLSIVPSGLGELGMPAVTDSIISGVATDVSAWFSGNITYTGQGFISAAKLTSIKLNRIGPDGHYVDQDAKEHVYPSPVAGAGTGNIAPQLSLVATLGTAIERGRGSKGRMYLAPTDRIQIGADGRISQTHATDTANGVKILIDSLNARYTLVGRCGVASDAGAGRFEHITRIGVGRVVDTMRSRRSSLLEDRQEVTL